MNTCVYQVNQYLIGFLRDLLLIAYCKTIKVLLTKKNAVRNDVSMSFLFKLIR